MKKFLVLVFLIHLSAMSIYAQKSEKVKGNRIVTKVETELPSFRVIDLDESFDIKLLYGKTPSVVIETDENLHNFIEFTVNDSTLSFNFLKKITSKKRLKIQVNYNDSLNELITRGNSTINVISSVKSSNFKILSEGISKVTMTLTTNDFVLESKEKSKIFLNLNCINADLSLQNNAKLDAQINNDSTTITLQQRANAGIDGNVETIHILADNHTTFNGKNYTAKSVIAAAEISSIVTIEVVDDITIEASGNSTINIYGNPEIAVKRLVDTSKIQKKVK